MQKFLVTLAAIATASVAFGQTEITSPPGYLTKPGNTNSKLHGFWMSGRTLEIDQTKDILAHQALRSIQHRRAVNFNYLWYLGMGRTFDKFTLTVAPAVDISKATSVFTANYASAGTEVYNAKTTFPNISTGTHKTNKWGDTTTYNFSKIFTKKKGEPLVLDWVHTGGKLSNGYTSTRNFGFSYVQDAFAGSGGGTEARGVRTMYPQPDFSGTCNDSAHTHTIGAYVSVFGSVYHSTYSGRNAAQYKGNQVASAFIYATAPSANAILLSSIKGDKNGLPGSPFGCYKLYADPAGALLIETASVASSGFWRKEYIVKDNPVMWGLETWSQAAWTDSSTKRANVTQASKYVLPKMPTPMKNVRFSVTTTQPSTATTGYTYFWDGGSFNAQNFQLRRYSSILSK